VNGPIDTHEGPDDYKVLSTDQHNPNKKVLIRTYKNKSKAIMFDTATVEDTWIFRHVIKESAMHYR